MKRWITRRSWNVCPVLLIVGSLAVLGSTSFARAQTVLFVSPQGNDACSGHVGVPAADLPEQQAGAQPIASGAGWLLADPKLIEYESGKVRFAPESPTGELKIETIDVSKAGCAGGSIPPSH